MATTEEQILQQNSLIADALYDLVRSMDSNQPVGTLEALFQDAKTKVNALNPDKYRFP